MTDASLLLFIAVIALAIGFLSGMLAGAARPRAGKGPSVTAEREQLNPGDRSEVARLWRDRRGRLMPELGGRLYHSPYEMKPELREKLKRLQVDLSLWLGSSGNAAPIAETGEQKGVQPPSLEILDVLSGAVRQVPVNGGAQGRSPAVTGVPGGSLAAESPAGKEAALSLAGQIDAILQEKLSASPLNGQSIHLADALGGGVVVCVGSEQYDGVEAVPDTQVKDLIRESVREWEQQG